MSTSMYLKSRDDIAAAARAAKRLGYKTTIADIRRNDRYVINVSRRLEGGLDCNKQAELEAAIVCEVKASREAL